MSVNKPSLFEQMLQANAEHELRQQIEPGQSWVAQAVRSAGQISRSLLFILSGFGSDLVTLLTASGNTQLTAFPKEAMVGSLGELATELSKGTEIAEEFVFATALTCLGAIVSGNLKLNNALDPETRLYTVLLGKSYSAKKSTAMARAIDFFTKIKTPYAWEALYGVGSAEGLAKQLAKQPNVLLAYDELRALIDKMSIKASVLLPMVASLFEKHSWDNATKESSVRVRNANLSFIGCCTNATYERVWTNEAIAIGMPNRLFVVDADAKPKVAWPKPPDQAVLEKLRQRIQQQVARLPLTFDITAEALALWDDWYKSQPNSEHAKRLDTIGLRLMSLIALTTDKDAVDAEVVQHVTAILDYELQLRMVTDPIDADDRIARLEIRIRKQLAARGPLFTRELRQQVHGDREGLWAFQAALKNLDEAGDIEPDEEGRVVLVVRAA